MRLSAFPKTLVVACPQIANDSCSILSIVPNFRMVAFMTRRNTVAGQNRTAPTDWNDVFQRFILSAAIGAFVVIVLECLSPLMRTKPVV